MKKILLVVSITGFMFAEGKIGGVTYFDFISIDDSLAFNFQRQYFGYGGEVSDQVSFNILFDIGRPELDPRLNVYLKKAQINYKSSLGKFNFGLIGMNTYGIQESNWGYRFIEQSAIDKYKFSATADIGLGFSRSLIDNLNLSLLFVNGEGFKKPQGDKYHKIAFNATYGEGNLNKNDGYNAGVVYTTESTDKHLITLTDPTTMASAFGGFSGMGLRLGVEYDMLTKGDTESSIISVSANYSFMDNKDIFLRYEMYDGDTSVDKDGSSYIITGILLSCGNGLSVVPNVRIKSYENDSKESEAIGYSQSV